MKIKAVVAVFFGILMSILIVNVASAHHPILTGETDCQQDGSWKVTWVARADADRDLTWEITSPGSYAPSGSQDDSRPFRRQVTLPNSTESVTESIRALWSNQAGGSATATVTRPEECVVPETTTTTTLVVETTTTTVVDDTTTTSIVAVAEPPVPTTVAPTSSISTEGAESTTTTPVSKTLPSTGKNSVQWTVIALTFIGIGAVMLRLSSKK